VVHQLTILQHIMHLSFAKNNGPAMQPANILQPKLATLGFHSVASSSNNNTDMII